MHKRMLCVAGAWWGILAATSIARANVTIQIDYSLDTSGFFSAAGNPDWQAARNVIEYVAASYSARLRDDLTQVSNVAGYDGGTWWARITHPATGVSTDIANLTVPANTIKVYVGGRAMSGSSLGNGGPGGYAVSYYNTPGSNAWYENLLCRGQTGALDLSPTDFGPWGGSIGFNSSANWYYGMSPDSLAAPKNDFFSVAFHEMAHLLGFGTARSFATLSNGADFYGTRSTGVYGGLVPLNSDLAHWDSSVNSTVGGATQQAAMTPTLLEGTRKRPTLVDWAALSDVGWHLTTDGDANGDGKVDFVDLVAVAQHYGQSLAAGNNVNWSTGDFDYDGVVGFSDLVAVAQRYNWVDPSGGATALGSSSFQSDWAAAQALAASVPEPVVLPVIGGFAVLLLRRSSGAMPTRAPSGQ